MADALVVTLNTVQTTPTIRPIMPGFDAEEPVITRYCRDLSMAARRWSISVVRCRCLGWAALALRWLSGLAGLRRRKAG